MKASEVFVSILSVVFILALSFVIVQPAVADETSVVISAPTGGDCFPPLGKWNATTQTCRLTEDIDLSSVGGDGITIISDGITFLCNGHTIQGDGSGVGISVSGKSGVTIKYCTVEASNYGIWLAGSDYNTVRNNTVDPIENYGIYIENSDYNTVNNNTADDNTVYGYVDFGIDNTFKHNECSGNRTAGSFPPCSGLCSP